MQKPRNIYHVGPIPGSPGGIATVIGIYLQRYQEKYHLEVIGTYAGKAQLALYIKAVLRVTWICLSEKKPLFHIHISKGGSCLRKIIIASVCNLFQKPFMLHIHGGQFLEFFNAQKSLVRRYLVFIFNRSVKIITLADYWKVEYGQLFDTQKVIVMPNPCPVLGEAGREKQNPIPVILFSGLLCQAKGIYDLIDAVKIVGQSHPILVRIFGNGEVEKVREYAAGMGSVTVFPWVDRAIMTEEYKRADIFILPSYIEGLPMVILEAMGNGLPIISTRVGGIPEIVIEGYNGFLLTPGDITGLSQKIAVLIDQKALREEMGQNSYQHVQANYTLENLDRQIEALYRSN